jgi:hypothetical protein
VRQLGVRLLALMPEPKKIWAELMTPSPHHYLPKRYEEMLHGFL